LVDFFKSGEICTAMRGGKKFFGNFHIILSGDPFQLPPVSGKISFCTPPKEVNQVAHDRDKKGYTNYRKFQDVIFLPEGKRFDNTQTKLLDLLNGFRYGFSELDYKTMKVFDVSPERMLEFKKAVYIAYDNVSVNGYNATQLHRDCENVISVVAEHSSTVTRSFIHAILFFGIHVFLQCRFSCNMSKPIFIIFESDIYWTILIFCKNA